MHHPPPVAVVERLHDLREDDARLGLRQPLVWLLVYVVHQRPTRGPLHRKVEGVVHKVGVHQADDVLVLELAQHRDLVLHPVDVPDVAEAAGVHHLDRHAVAAHVSAQPHHALRAPADDLAHLPLANLPQVGARDVHEHVEVLVHHRLRVTQLERAARRQVVTQRCAGAADRAAALAPPDHAAPGRRPCGPAERQAGHIGPEGLTVALVEQQLGGAGLLVHVCQQQPLLGQTIRVWPRQRQHALPEQLPVSQAQVLACVVAEVHHRHLQLALHVRYQHRHHQALQLVGAPQPRELLVAARRGEEGEVFLHAAAARLDRQHRDGALDLGAVLAHAGQLQADRCGAVVRLAQRFGGFGVRAI
mmetsp:Transcript_8966/g.23090  ORF Transcript_8966/g.23090 Transcript_8966/m.23090 type:complete len:360 (+) Transcript_8966:933-2012(+)